MVSSTRRLADEHLLEPALQRGVLLDVLAVLVERRRADHPQLAAGQHRLEHVAGVHRGVAGRAGADDGVQLVDERDDLAVAALDLVEDGLEPLLELAAVLRAGDHRAEVERDQPLAAQRLRHVAGDDPLRQPLDDGGLADAGLADQHRVVLGAAGQHLHDPADLGVPADDRVELALAGRGGEVDAVLLQRLVRGLGVRAGDARRAAHLRRTPSSSAPASRRARRAASATSAAVGASPTSRCSVDDVVVAELVGERPGRGSQHAVASRLRATGSATLEPRRARAAGQPRPRPRGASALRVGADGVEQRRRRCRRPASSRARAGAPARPGGCRPPPRAARRRRAPPGSWW